MSHKNFLRSFEAAIHPSLLSVELQSCTSTGVRQSRHGYILPRGGGRQRAPGQPWSTSLTHGTTQWNASSEREAEPGGRDWSFPRSRLTRTSHYPLPSLTSSLCSTPKAGRMRGLCLCHSETRTWGNPWRFLQQPGGSLVPSLFHLLSTYVGIKVHTNCTTPSAGQELPNWI